VIADEAQRGPETRANDRDLGDSLIQYAPLLVFMLGASDGHWRDDKVRKTPLLSHLHMKTIL
jgi:hypothetical protein